MENKKLKVLDILIEALTVFHKNINFAIFTFLTSLPLFCFLVYYETYFQKFLHQTSEDFQPKSRNSVVSSSLTSDSSISYYTPTRFVFNTDWSIPLDIVRNLNKDLFQELLQLGFLYLVPLHLLELCTILVTVDLASKIYREEKALTYTDMLQHIRNGKARLRGTFITFLYVVFLSTCTLIGFIWLLITYSAVWRYYSSESYFILRIDSFGFDVFLHLLYGSNLLLLLIIYLVWSAIWNLGLVISVLEGSYGVRALGSAAYLSLRNARNGVILMLVFSVWGLGLRLPCLGYGCYKTRPWIFVQIGLFCLGNALKWVSFVVYFQDCIRRISGKKVVGQEQG